MAGTSLGGGHLSSLVFAESHPTIHVEMERVMGIEPTLAAWEAAVLPLNYTRAGGAIIARAVYSGEMHQRTNSAARLLGALLMTLGCAQAHQAPPCARGDCGGFDWQPLGQGLYA